MKTYLTLFILLAISAFGAELKNYTIATAVTAGSVDNKKLRAEVAASGAVTNFDGFITRAGVVSVIGDSISNETLLDSTFLNHDPIETLAELKIRRYVEIDTKTKTLISLGEIFDSKTFSNSKEAQQNHANLQAAIDAGRKTSGDFPINVAVTDNSAYSLTWANAQLWLDAMVNGKQGHIDSGLTLKDSVFTAVDKTAVDAVVDTR